MVGRSPLAQFDATRRETASETRRVTRATPEARLLTVRARIDAAESAPRHPMHLVSGTPIPRHPPAGVAAAKVFSIICVLVGLACAYYAR